MIHQNDSVEVILSGKTYCKKYRVKSLRKRCLFLPWFKCSHKYSLKFNLHGESLRARTLNLCHVGSTFMNELKVWLSQKGMCYKSPFSFSFCFCLSSQVMYNTTSGFYKEVLPAKNPHYIWPSDIGLPRFHKCK